MYSKEELLSNSVEQLKDIAKTIGAALTSKLRKEEIIYAILDKQAEVEGDTAPKRHRTRIVKKDTDRVYSVNGTDGENFDSKKNKIQANADSPTIFSEQDIANAEEELAAIRKHRGRKSKKELELIAAVEAAKKYKQSSK
jgi:transcription termination factor Rho